MNHCGMETNGADVAALINLVRDNGVKTVVEVGTWVGATACRLADEGCSVTCIDWFQGMEYEGDRIGKYETPGVVYDAFRLNTGGRLWRTIFPILGKSEAVDWVLGPFDLAFIDADHRYEQCRKDILRWLPCVRSGGIIACHDYESAFPGVMQAVDETRGKEFTVSGHSLAWWRV